MLVVFLPCTVSLLRPLSLCVCEWVPTTHGAPHRQGRQSQLVEAASVSHSLITARAGNVFIDARKNIFLVCSHVPNIFENSDMEVFQTQRGVLYWHGKWTFKQASSSTVLALVYSMYSVSNTPVHPWSPWSLLSKRRRR